MAERVCVQVRELLGDSGKEVVRTYDYPYANLVDPENVTINQLGLFLPFKDGTHAFHNLRYIEQTWSE